MGDVAPVEETVKVAGCPATAAQVATTHTVRHGGRPGATVRGCVTGPPVLRCFAMAQRQLGGPTP